MVEPEPVFLALGSNEGDRLANMRAAVTALRAEPGIALHGAASVASLYETRPIGGPADQANYLNSALRITTPLAPHALLLRVMEIERRLGRVRDVRWGPRVIDIDLLLFGDRVIRTDTLTLPHPRLHERLFVLAPLAEIGAGVLHPILGVSVSALADAAWRDPRTAGGVVRSAGSEWADGMSASGRTAPDGSGQRRGLESAEPAE